MSEKPAARSNYDLYLNGTTLIYLNEPCSLADTRGRFLRHVFPADPADLRGVRTAQGFNTLNFDFAMYGARFDGKCLIRRELPGYDIPRLRVGQWVPGGSRIWQVEVPLPH